MTTKIAYPLSNLKEIVKAITQDIIGEVCAQVTFSYGDELKLDFGEMSSYDHPKLKHLKKGNWRLNTRASDWVLSKAQEILIDSATVINDEQLEQVKTLMKVLENQTLTSFTMDNQTLILNLSFTNGYQFTLKPDLEDDSGLSYWELFMPTAQVLSVGQHRTWECKSINSRA